MTAGFGTRAEGLQEPGQILTAEGKVNHPDVAGWYLPLRCLVQRALSPDASCGGGVAVAEEGSGNTTLSSTAGPRVSADLLAASLRL